MPQQPSDESVIDSSVFKDVFDAIKNRKLAILVTGKAGTGKTTLVKTLLEEKLNQVVVAPTGIAAINVCGQTIHSFFQLAPGLQDLKDIEPIKNAKTEFIIKNMERLIIDEVSMVRADLLDKIDYVLRVTRNKMNTAFGGVQVVMVGDFYQLAPVVSASEAEVFYKLGYNSPFAYDATVLKDVELTKIELSKVFRQKEDRFVKLLSAIRIGKDIKEVTSLLNSSCLRNHRDGKIPILLTATNSYAENYNLSKLQAIISPSKKFEGILTGKFNLTDDQLPAPRVLELKIGARIMLIKNDPRKRWVNGTLGEIVEIYEDRVDIKLDENNEVHDVSRAEWDRYRYIWNSVNKRIEREVVGSYMQIPIKLAWATTIHKAQGLTLEDVRLDLHTPAFASGQLYVALSRATSIEGLSFAAPIRHRDVIVEAKIAEKFR